MSCSDSGGNYHRDGVAIDVYTCGGIRSWRKVMQAGAARRILAFHVCDWLAPTRDLLLDRGMMGDGVIDIRSIRGLVEAAGYDRLIEVEIFSRDNWWKRDPDEVLRSVAERYRTVV